MGRRTGGRANRQGAWCIDCTPSLYTPSGLGRRLNGGHAGGAPARGSRRCRSRGQGADDSGGESGRRGGASQQSHPSKVISERSERAHSLHFAVFFNSLACPSPRRANGVLAAEAHTGAWQCVHSHTRHWGAQGDGGTRRGANLHLAKSAGPVSLRAHPLLRRDTTGTIHAAPEASSHAVPCDWVGGSPRPRALKILPAENNTHSPASPLPRPTPPGRRGRAGGLPEAATGHASGRVQGEWMDGRE